MKFPEKDTNCELNFKQPERNVLSATIMKRELQIHWLKSLSLKWFFKSF